MQGAAPFDQRQALAPLPRAHHWVDGSAYVNHVELVRKARKADMPARVAERVAPTRGRRGAIDAESEEVTDEPVDDDGGGATDESGDESRDETDPLAELEAEMEAEDRSRRGGGGDPSRGSTPEE